MHPTRLLLVLLAAALMLGCAASAKKMNQLQLGMTEKEVVTAIGEPGSTSSKGDEVLLKYRLRASGLWKATYYVRLQNGKVDAFGQVGDFGLGY
ncbi:MAG: hypothetical protein AMJ54_04085 [Deltaproteobacteria bacterium SG8_13]|nr:MAG: hypothetical protein AMJ54_04085 [Deltaproteobacteria bacterium SG8_13]